MSEINGVRAHLGRRDKRRDVLCEDVHRIRGGGNSDACTTEHEQRGGGLVNAIRGASLLVALIRSR